METVITWKLRTSLRRTKCDLLSDGGESELISSRCWRCSTRIYIFMWGIFMHGGMSRSSFSRMLKLNQTDGSQPRFNNIWCVCDALSSSSARDDFIYIMSTAIQLLYSHLLLYCQLFCIIPFLFYLRQLAVILVFQNSSWSNMFMQPHFSSTRSVQHGFCIVAQS